MVEPARWMRVLLRVRTPLVLLPLLALLLVAGGIGASRLFADLPERAAPVPEVTCWDGSTGLEGRCSPPTGRAGLRWVFPSFSPDDARCTRARRPAGDPPRRPLEFTCALTLDQRAVTVTYTARTSLEQGLAFLRRTYGGSDPVRDPEAGTVLFAARRPEDGTFRATLAYAEEPFSVTVEAPERALRDTALDELVELRPAAEVAALG